MAKKRKSTEQAKKKLRERAWQFWPLLVWAASKSQILTYDEIEKAAGGRWDSRHRQSGKILGVVKRYSKRKFRRSLNVIVVNKQGEVGEGAPNFETAAEERMDVYAYKEKWLSKRRAPGSPDAFEGFEVEE